MPIVNCFDSVTGASGGDTGGGGVAGLPDWEAIDITDGTWTSSDPGGDGRVSSVSVSSGQTTVTWNGFTSDADGAMDGNTYNGQRYYKELKYPDGTSVSLSDAGWMLETWVDIPTVAGCARAQYALGVSSNPTSTTRNTINLGGLYFSPDRTDGVPLIGMTRGNTSPLAVYNATNRYGYGRSAFVSGKGGLAFGWAIKSDGTHAAFNNRSLANYTGTVYLHLNAGVPNGRTMTSGQTNVFSIFYRVIKTPIGPEGNRP